MNTTSKSVFSYGVLGDNIFSSTDGEMIKKAMESIYIVVSLAILLKRKDFIDELKKKYPQFKWVYIAPQSNEDFFNKNTDSNTEGVMSASYVWDLHCGWLIAYSDESSYKDRTVTCCFDKSNTEKYAGDNYIHHFVVNGDSYTSGELETMLFAFISKMKTLS